MEDFILKYRKYIEECKNGLHDSQFATRFMRLHDLKARWNNAVSDWNNSWSDLCVALDNENQVCDPSGISNFENSALSLLSHIQLLSEEISTIELMLHEYLESYFETGFVIEEKLASGHNVTQKEFESFDTINRLNPFADSPYDESILSAKCYIDILSDLTNEDDYGLVDEINALLFLTASEFKTNFALNPDSYDKQYLKYILTHVGEDGLARTLYNPVEVRIRRKNERSSHTRLLEENQDFNPINPDKA